MDQSRYEISHSTDDADKRARVIIDGALSLAVERTMVTVPDGIGVALSEASSSLAMAAALHQGGDQREGFKWALRASIDFFRFVGFPEDQLGPFKHLRDALEGLDRGSKTPALTPDEVHNRPTDDPSKWNFRACLAVALDIRMRMGESADLASQKICSAIQIARDPKMPRKAQSQRLIDLRKKFKSGQVPEGKHRAVFDNALAELDQLNPSLMDMDDPVAWFSRAADACIKAARVYREQAFGFKPGG